MASHHQPSAEILPLHRGVVGQPLDYPEMPRNVRPIPAEHLACIMGEPVDLYKSLEQPRRGLLDRIADALGSERMFGFFLGFYAGIMFGCTSLIFWLAVLK